MSKVVKFSIPSIIIIVVADIVDAEKRLPRFSMKILRIFFFDDKVVRDEQREMWREDAEEDAEEEEMRARPTIWCFFLNERERLERSFKCSNLFWGKTLARRKDTDKI